MKSTQLLLFFLLLTGISMSCSSSPENAGAEQEPAATETETTPPAAEEQQITAKFVEFSLGDASHFLFEDESGQSWDFAGNEDPKYAFAQELPAEAANETNQGWGSDENLQGKWFVISYVYKEQAQYPDGPMVNVPVIVKAVPKD